MTFYAPEVMRVLNALTGDMSRKELQNKLSLKDDEHLRKAYLPPALKTAFIETTMPDKPKSRMQKYRMTKHGQVARKSGGKKWETLKPG